MLQVHVYSKYNPGLIEHQELTTLYCCGLIHFAFMFLKVWKVKKAFKIQIFWKGGKPTFQVCWSAPLRRLHPVVPCFFWLDFFFFFAMLKQYGKLDESERRTEEYDTLVRSATSLLVRRGGDADVPKPWFLLCFSEGHEVSVVPAVPAVRRRGRVRPHFPAVQEVGCGVWTRATTVQHNWLTWQPIVPLF